MRRGVVLMWCRGNEYFKTGEYSTAIDLYTQCIQLCPEDATFYGNRAAAYLMDKKYQSALTDALKAIALDPKAEKACAPPCTALHRCNAANTAAAVAVCSRTTALPSAIRHLVSLIKRAKCSIA